MENNGRVDVKRGCRRQDLKCPFCFSTTMAIISPSLNFTETHRWKWYLSNSLSDFCTLFYSRPTLYDASVNYVKLSYKVRIIYLALGDVSNPRNVAVFDNYVTG